MLQTFFKIKAQFLILYILFPLLGQANDKVAQDEIIEFGFVLLADEQQTAEVKALADSAFQKILVLPQLSNDATSFSKHSSSVTHPHVSIGQYALKKSELPKLKEIIKKVAVNLKTITESMASTLTVTKENIFFDVSNQKVAVNPVIKKLYLNLRSAYMRKIKSKQFIRQALQAEKDNQDKPEELTLLKNCYQNWGTPEKNRINLHFTLVYNYKGNKSEVEDKVKLIEIPKTLKQIKFTRLAILAIDYWGNPLPNDILYSVPLR